MPRRGVALLLGLLQLLTAEPPLASATATCTVQLVANRAAALNTACCHDTPTNCDANGLPDQCSASCAHAFLPFWADCNAVVAKALPGQHKTLAALRDKCLVSLRKPIVMCGGSDSGSGSSPQHTSLPRGVIVDGSGNKNYTKGMDCGLLITAPLGQRVVLKFLAFDLNPRSALFSGGGGGGRGRQTVSTGDYVRLFNGANDTASQEIAWLTGLKQGTAAGTWVSSSNQMFVRFSSDESIALYSKCKANPFGMLYPRGCTPTYSNAQGFSATYIFSGEGAACTLGKRGQPWAASKIAALLPANSEPGSCAQSQHNGALSSGGSCTFGCRAGYGLNGTMQRTHEGDQSPSYPFFSNSVICFDGSLEVRGITCTSTAAMLLDEGGALDICHPPTPVLTTSHGMLTDGSGSNSAYSTNMDCGVLIMAPPGASVSVRFSQFSTASDRVTLYDGTSAAGDMLKELYGLFTCSENSTGCLRSQARQINAVTEKDLGVWHSKGRALFVHFATLVRNSRRVLSYGSQEGFKMEWITTGVGAPCSLAHMSLPLHGGRGTCGASRTLRSGEQCTLRCAEGTVPSTGASRATWRVLPYISPNLSHQPVCWKGALVNAKSIVCLSSAVCSNYELGPKPTLAALSKLSSGGWFSKHEADLPGHGVACPVHVNGAPAQALFAPQDADARSQGGKYADKSNVWFALQARKGVHYSIATRLGSATFTWLYLYSFAHHASTPTQLAKCVYCRANHRDRSSIISWTCPRTATYYIRVHGSEYLGDGFVLNVTAPELPLTDAHMRKPTPMNQCRNMSQLRAWAGLARGPGGTPKVFHVCKATPQQLGRLQISGEAAVVGLRRGAPLVKAFFEIFGTTLLRFLGVGAQNNQGYGTSVLRQGGGAAFVHQGAKLTAVSVVFTSNAARGGGGAIYCDSGGSMAVEHSAFIHNTAIHFGGGAVAVEGNGVGNGCVATISDSHFVQNHAHQNGGAISVGGKGSLTLHNVTFAGNACGKKPWGGAAIYWHGACAGTCNINCHPGFGMAANGHCWGNAATPVDIVAPSGH